MNSFEEGGNRHTISTEIGFRLIVPEQTAPVPVVASLFYTAEDPYAIRVAFHVGLDEPVEWIFARDLLAAGAKKDKAVGEDQIQGYGDVRVSRSELPEGSPTDVLNVQLTSPFGQANFETSANEVEDFLARTYNVVAQGAETNHIDLDTEITDLLRGA